MAEHWIDVIMNVWNVAKKFSDPWFNIVAQLRNCQLNLQEKRNSWNHFEIKSECRSENNSQNNWHQIIKAEKRQENKKTIKNGNVFKIHDAFTFQFPSFGRYLESCFFWQKVPTIAPLFRFRFLWVLVWNMYFTNYSMKSWVKTCKPFVDSFFIQKIALICGHDLFTFDSMWNHQPYSVLEIQNFMKDKNYALII